MFLDRNPSNLPSFMLSNLLNPSAFTNPGSVRYPANAVTALDEFLKRGGSLKWMNHYMRNFFHNSIFCPLNSAEDFLNYGYALEVLGKKKTSALEKKAGIQMFLRYPPWLLDSAYATLQSPHCTNKPLLLLVTSSVDWNGALYNSDWLPKILSEHYRILIAEAGSVGEFCYRINAISSRYGRISALVLHAHGDPEGILLDTKASSFEHGMLTYTLFSTKEMTSHAKRRLSKLARCFTDTPTVVLNSCSTGYFHRIENPIGAMLSRVWNARLFAPSAPSSVSALVVDSTGLISDVEFYSAVSQEFVGGIPQQFRFGSMRP
jgi:hypothetical protein